ncbi:MAG: M56 family metallopeptidase, partial [Bacteroidota bacterium]
MNFQILFEALGWTILHSLWQGLLLYLVYLGVRYLMRNHAPQGRYLAALMTLGALCVVSGITFYQYLPDVGAVLQVEPSDEVAYIPMVWPETPSEPDEITWRDRFHEALPLIGWAWVLGVAVMLLRWAGGLFSLYQLRNSGLKEAPGEWNFFVNNWASEWNIRRKVNIWLSEKATAPLTMGYLRPIILIPLSLVPDLTPEQWEAVLLHELAHIRRADYLIRLIQSLIEILFFYHPLVAWLSKEIAREREACCDDQAVAACGDALEYAQALTTLQRMCNHPQTSIAMSTHSYPGNFTTRIKRLFAHTPQPGTPRATLLMIGLFMTCLVSFGWANRPDPEPNAVHQTQQGDFFLTIDRSYTQDKMNELVEELRLEGIDFSLLAGSWTVAGELEVLLAEITFEDGFTDKIFAESLESMTIIREAGSQSLDVCVLRVGQQPEPPFSLIIDRTYTQEQFQSMVSQLKEQGITLATRAVVWNDAGELSNLFGSITFEDGVSGSFEILHLDTLYIHREPKAKELTIAVVSQEKEGFFLTLDRTYSPERLDKLVEDLKAQSIDLDLIAVGWNEKDELNDLIAEITFADGTSTDFEARGLKHLTILKTEPEGIRVLISQRGPANKKGGDSQAEAEETGASFGIGLGPSMTREGWEAMVKQFAADGLTFDIEQISFTKANALWTVRGTVTYEGQTNAFELGPDEMGVLLISKDRFEFPKKQIANKAYDVEGITLEIGPEMTLDEFKALPKNLDWQGVEVILESAQADCDGYLESAKGTFILEGKSASFDIQDGKQKAIVKIGNNNAITIDIQPAEARPVSVVEEIPVVEGKPVEEVLDKEIVAERPIRVRNVEGVDPLYVVNGIIVPKDS